MRRYQNLKTDSCFGQSRFQSLISRYETKIALYEELKSKIDAFSEDYDLELSRTHWHINEIGGKIDFELPEQRIDALPRNWTRNILESIDKIVECIGGAERLVSDYFLDFPVIDGEYGRKLNLLKTKFHFEFNLKDASRAYQSLTAFKSIEGQLPPIENPDDKSREYSHLWRVAMFDKKVRGHQSDFGALIHDSRHYLDRLRSIVKSTMCGPVKVRTIHSIDALQCALYVLRRDYYLGRESSNCSTHQPYEPYKLFHKFQYCFSEEFDSIDWLRGGDAEGAHLRWVDGMETVALNLYANAAKYIPKDGQSYDVTTSFVRQKDGLLITVTSVGPFVPTEELEEIFKMGKRASTADIGSKSGSGRGLARVKAVCDKAGYAVWADSVRRIDLKPEWADFSVYIKVPVDLIVE